MSGKNPMDWVNRNIDDWKTRADKRPEIIIIYKLSKYVHLDIRSWKTNNHTAAQL